MTSREEPNVRLKPEIQRWHEELTAWRHDLHAHPELGFEETRTSRFVAEKLSSWGIAVHRGLAGTGVVGALHGCTHSDRAIALRADMDALPMQEENEFAHASMTRGKMHGCGHDGHTTMLLGAARYLAQSRDFAGTVFFVFQPAEEGLGGGDRMVKEGLFNQFPCEAVYGFHNWPGMPIGTIGTRAGPMMAAADLFTIDIVGKGGHAALPHHTTDPVVIAAHLVTAMQTLVSRSTDPLEAAVVSVTGIEGGKAYNVIPERARLFGTVRSFTPAVRDSLEVGLKRLAEGTASMFGARAEINYERKYPPVVNSRAAVERAARAASAVVGEANVDTSITPIMGSEDFAFMLEAKPGAYLFLGQAGGPSSCMIHNPRYDFNDALLPVGVSFWVALVEQVLATDGAQ
jgi:amidohydrolase